MRSLVGCGCLVLTLVPPPVAAQTTTSLPPAARAPSNVVLPNYNSVGIGETGSIEANAFVARAVDSSAAWYNPAGLTLAKQNSVSGSAGMFQVVAVTPDNLIKSGTSFQQIPSMVSVVVKNLFGSPKWAGGVSIARTSAWSQYVDAERTYGGTSSERLMYSSLGDFSAWMVDIALGHTSGGKTRVGASIDGQYTDSERSGAWSDQYQSASFAAAVVQAHGYQWTVHLRGSLGAQYEFLPRLRVGAIVRTPGFKVLSGGSFNHEGMSQAGTATTTASFFEPSPAVQYKVPFEFKAGVAWEGRRAQLECDVLTYASAGTYNAFETSRAWTVITAGGTAPVSERPAFDVPVIDSESVVNLAVGGHVDLTASGAWKLHGGYATDRSPVGPDDTYFTKIDLGVVTAGISGHVKFLLGSVGVRYEFGESGVLQLQALQNGQAATTRLRVSNIGVLYSLALLF